MTRRPALVAIVEDDPTIASLVARQVRSMGHETCVATTVGEGRRLLMDVEADLVLVDLDLHGERGLDLVTWMNDTRQPCPFAVVTASAAVNDVVESMRAGAIEYLLKPIDRSVLRPVVDHALQMRQQRATQDDQGQPVSGFGMVGQSMAMRRVTGHIERLARCSVSVLVTGETGTGKELVARAIHEGGQRASSPFVAVNCGAIADGLRESTFFGHERGAFTGAVSQHQGAIEAADGGTLFLDEVGELNPTLQVMLLRAIQERTIRRVGGTKEIDVDFRVIAATHRDLFGMVADGSFREDLLYRLAVYDLTLPRLRDRGEDVMLLARHFLSEFTRDRPTPVIGPEFARVLRHYHWPGNVRELRNAMERVAVVCEGDEVALEHLPRRIVRPLDAPRQGQPGHHVPVHGDSVATDERSRLMAAIEAANGNVSMAIRSLGIPRTTMYRKLRKYGLLDQYRKSG